MLRLRQSLYGWNDDGIETEQLRPRQNMVGGGFRHPGIDVIRGPDEIDQTCRIGRTLPCPAPPILWRLVRIAR